jgi:hypothetical protein
LSLSIWGTNFMDICCMFTSSIRICWHVPCERSNLPAISELVHCQTALMILWTFSMFLSLWPVEGQPERSQSSTEVSSHLNWENNKHLFSAFHCHQKLFWAFHAFLTQFSHIWSDRYRLESCKPVTVVWCVPYYSDNV